MNHIEYTLPVTDEFKLMSSATEFYHKLAQDKLKDFLNLNLDAKQLSKLLVEFDQYQAEKTGEKYLGFINRFEKGTPDHQCALLMGQIVALSDQLASNKQELNETPNKRVVSKSGIYQNKWIRTLVDYKLGVRDDRAVIYCFDYLLTPQSYTSILQQPHRQLIYEKLFGLQNFTEEKFVEAVQHAYEESSLEGVHPDNVTRVMTNIFYQEKYKDIWDPRPTKYWAGGFLWGEVDKKDDFIENEYWQLGWDRHSESPDAKKCWRRFKEIGIGDKFIIKGYGGTHSLKTHLYAEVLEVDSKIGHIKLKADSDRSKYHGDAPRGVGAGNWRDALLEVKREQDIAMIWENETVDEEIEINEFPMRKYPLNQILFGPPGTGKTWNTINYSVAIIENKSIEDVREEAKYKEGRQSVKSRYDQYLKVGQIIFTTFHQSMSYEDFVEGIKPNSDSGELQYEIADGLFKQVCGSRILNKASNSVASAIDQFKKLINEEEIELATAQGKGFRLGYHGNKTFRVFPKKSTMEGHERGYPVSISHVEKHILGEEDPKIYNISYVRAIAEFLISKYQIKVTSDSEKQNSKPVILIIDEVNRANVSAVFGELITLLEDDKRIGAENEIKLKLPYSKEDFGVPNNVHILGTMNTADRSVEAIDTALRRRFHFVEMMPQADLIPENIAGVDLPKMLSTINQRLEYLVGRDHTIGHAYFMEVDSKKSLEKIFANKVIPQLQEYFYGDWSKIQLVLGKSFVKQKLEQSETKISWPEGLDYDGESMSSFEIESDCSLWDFEDIYAS